jgi:hypothetical protein
VPDNDAVVGADHTASRGSLALAVDGGAENVGRGDSGGSGRGLFDEIPARVTAGHWLSILGIHSFNCL